MSYTPKPLFNATVQEIYRELQRVGIAFRRNEEIRYGEICPELTLRGSSDPGRDVNHGTLLFDASTTEVAQAMLMLPRTMVPYSEVVPAVRWAKTTSASGTVMWQIEYKKWKAGSPRDGSWTAISSSATTVSDGDTALQHAVTPLTAISTSDMTFGDAFVILLSRLGGSDTYGADAELISLDILYQVDNFNHGSRKEYMK